MLTNSAKQTIISSLEQVFTAQLQGILLYGSRASGQSHDQSDYDLGILLKKPISATLLWETAQDLACLLQQDVDLIDLRSATTVLQKEATVGGVWLLKVDPYACDFFDTCVISMYQELQENRQDIIDHLMNGINHG